MEKFLNGVESESVICVAAGTNQSILRGNWPCAPCEQRIQITRCRSEARYVTAKSSFALTKMTADAFAGPRATIIRKSGLRAGSHKGRCAEGEDQAGIRRAES